MESAADFTESAPQQIMQCDGDWYIGYYLLFGPGLVCFGEEFERHALSSLFVESLLDPRVPALSEGLANVPPPDGTHLPLFRLTFA